MNFLENTYLSFQSNNGITHSLFFTTYTDMDQNYDMEQKWAAMGSRVHHLEQTFGARVRSALEKATPMLASASIFCELAKDMARCADSGQLSPIPLHYMGFNIDNMVVTLYMSEGVMDARHCKETVKEYTFIRCVLEYCVIRVKDVLQWKREGRALAPVSWEALDDVMIYVIKQGLKMKLVDRESPLGSLFITPGFMTTFETVVRGNTRKLVNQGLIGEDAAVRIARSLSCSSLMVSWQVTHPEMFTPGDASVSGCKVGLSLLGTLLKSEYLLENLLTNRTVHGEKLITMLQCTVTNLQAINQFMCPYQTGDSNRLAVELMVTKALVAGHRLLGIVGPGNLSADVKQWCKEEVFNLQQRVNVLVEEKQVKHMEHLGCHHAQCLSLKGLTESMMDTRLCSACRRVRYCSVACQRDDLQAHRVRCRMEVE